MTEIGTLLRTARGPRSMYAVERVATIPHSSISKAERGVTLPTLSLLRRLAIFYSCESNLYDWIAALERDRIAAQRARMEKEVVPDADERSVA